MPTSEIGRYTSNRQRARVASEAWGETNLFCANCTSSKLTRTRTNTPAIDYACPRCDALFQLKSQGHRIGVSIPDAAYDKMCEAIAADKTPNLFALHYEPDSWCVKNLILIPRFALTISFIKRRRPLSPDAERHGWVGCTILLGSIPAEARIPVVTDGKVAPANQVREQYRRLRPLARLGVETRGWTLDVLNAVRSLNKSEFALPEVYTLETALGRLHPKNRHVRHKIRQQLQVIRDLGFLEFLGGGNYRLL